jgi:uncharacterized protein YjeT (DUF2065 family)
MRFAIQLIGIVIIVQICVFLLRIDLLREMLKFFSRGSRLYITAVVRIAIAIILFIGATQCRRFWIIIALAAILLLSGITIFTLKPATFKKLLTWYLARSDLFLRLTAAIGLIFGIVIIYAA